MRFSLTEQRKGQSAIEYLTTYGWMLLVVAIVGGAIFTTVQGQSQIQSVTGFSGTDVGIDSFGTTGESLALQLVSQGSNPVTPTAVNLSRENAQGNIVSAYNGSVAEDGVDAPIPLGETRQVLVGNVTSGDSSQTFDITITYTTGELSGLQQSGTITGSFEIIDEE